MKITIAGLGGTGTSTVAKLLAKELGYEVMSGGDIFRQMAKEKGMTIYEFDEYVKANPHFDKILDKKQEEYGKTHDNFVLESRIGWFFIPDAFKIKLECELNERIRRVQEREGGDEEILKEKTLAREATYTPRYKALYGIDDWQADKHFDMIIDATVDTPDIIVANIIKRLHK